MKLSKVREILQARVLTGEEILQMEVCVGGGADLMSDVLAFAHPDCLLLTGLATRQVIYTAEMASIRAICFVRGKVPDDDVVRLAREKEMILLTTPIYMYDSCGRLSDAGLPGHWDVEEGRRKSGCL